MKGYLLYTLLVLFAISAIPAFGQQKSKSRVKLAPREINKLPKIDLDLVDKEYPSSYLYKVNKSSITLINKSIHNKTFQSVYFQGKIDFDEINSITIHSKKRRLKTNLWGAAIGGVTGYFIGKLVAREDFNQISIELLSQRPSAGFMEPILGAIVGASVGIAIGDLFTPITLDNVNKNPRQSALYLRGIDKKIRKKKRR